MKPIFRDLTLANPEPGTDVLLGDDFASPGFLDPVPAAQKLPQAPPPSVPAPEDPIAVMRKIFVGSEVEQVKTQLAAVQKQLDELRDSLSGRMQESERTLRDDIGRVSKAAADALQAQTVTLTHDIEQTRASLVTSVDERFRKLAAASVPRTHLAEILRDLSSRLQPAAPVAG